MKVFVTGAGGFIGSAIVRYLHSSGHTVSGSSHNLNSIDDSLRKKLACCVEFDFTKKIPLDILKEHDAIIHCSYSRNASYKTNIQGTIAISEDSKKSGIPFQLFISSHSSRADATSVYGKIKYTLEKYFLENYHSVIRPGLVIGPGGFFLNQMRMLEKIPVVALPAARMSPVFYISIADLLTCIDIITINQMRGVYNLFYSEPSSIRDFVKAIHDIPVVSIPTAPLFFITRILRTANKHIPAWLERIETLRQNIYEPIHISNLTELVSSPMKLQEAIDKVRSDTNRTRTNTV